MKTLLLISILPLAAWSQCRLILNPVTGLLDCTGSTDTSGLAPAASPTFTGTVTNSGVSIFTSSTQQTVVAGTTIQPDATFIRISSAAPVTLTSVPTIAAGVSPNQLLFIFNFSTHPITFQDRGTLSGSTLALQTSTVTLQPAAVLTLHFAGSLWRQGSTGRTVVGTSLPATCISGEFFVKSDATDGMNLYACTATNTYKLQGGVTQLAANPGVTVDSPTGVVTVGTDTAITPRYSTTAGAPAGACVDGLDYNVDVTNDIMYFCSGSAWVQANSEAAGTIPVTTEILKGNGAGSAAAATPGVDFAEATHEHSAADVTSGTLPLVRGGSNQTTWTAGRCVQVNAGGTALESAADACGTGGGSGKTIFMNNVAATIGISATAWTGLGGGGFTTTSPGHTRRSPISTAGTLGRAFAVAGAAWGADSVVCTLQVNGSDTAIVVTIPASAAASSVHSDTTNTVSVSAGDHANWKCVNNLAGTSGTLASLSVELTF